MAYEGLRQLFGPVVRYKIKEVRDLERLPPRPPFVMAANHVGFLDAPALVIIIHDRCKQATHFITKPYLWYMLGGPLARHWMGMVPRFNHQQGEALAEAIRILQRGEIVGVFPEGTRNPDPHTLLKGKTGAVRMALAAHVPLIPAGITNTTGQFIGAAFKSLFNKNSFVNIQIGRQIDLSEFKDKPIDKPLLEEATRKLMTAVGELCGKVYPY